MLQISSPKAESDHDKGTAKKLLAAVEANQIASQHPELSRKQISQHAATEVTEADTQAHLHHAQSLLREKDLMQQENKADDQWTVATTKLPENMFAFGMEAITDTFHTIATFALGRKSKVIAARYVPVTASNIVRHNCTY